MTAMDEGISDLCSEAKKWSVLLVLPNPALFGKVQCDPSFPSDPAASPVDPVPPSASERELSPPSAALVPFESDARSGELPASLIGGIPKNSPDSPQAVSDTKTMPDQVSQRRRMPYLPLLVHYQTIEISRLVH